MRLSDVWFTALSENESGQMITVYGRDELNEFTESGKFKERVEITWKYEGDGRGLPCDDLGEKMEVVEEALRKAMEKKDKLASSPAEVQYIQMVCLVIPKAIFQKCL